MRICFTTVAWTLWEHGLIVTVHCVHRLAMELCAHKEGFGADEIWGTPRNLLLSLILHSLALLIQEIPFSDDCVVI